MNERTADCQLKTEGFYDTSRGILLSIVHPAPHLLRGRNPFIGSATIEL